MSLSSPLRKVKGLGAAKSGTHHWYMQRVTALALLPLTLWLVASIISLVGQDYSQAVQWLAQPWCATFMILFILFSYYHAALGIQVVSEDYVNQSGTRTVLLLLVKFALIVLAAVSVVSILKIAI